MATVDWLILAAYLVLIVFMGGWFARRQHSTEAFFLAGRSVPWWAVGFSFFGSSISTGTFLAFPGQGFGGDWVPHLSHLIFPVIAVLAACWVIPYYRQRVRMSAYEFLEQRFGYGTRCYASAIYVVYHLFRNGMILFLMAKALNAMTGWDPVAILIVSGILALLYTMLGGLEAVIWTDVLQSVTLFGGGLFCLWFLTFGSDGGALHLFQVAGDAGKFKLVDWSLDLSHPTIVVIILYGLFHHGTYYTTSQDVAQRYLAAASTRSSQKALLFGGLSIVTTWTLFLLIGSLLYAYYQIHPGQLPAEIAAKETQIFPYFVMQTIPPGITGLILAGMCAAAMSSLDTTINSLAMISVRDFYLHFRPQASDRRQLRLGRIASGVWGLLGIGSGLLMLAGVERAYYFGATVSSFIGGGILGLFLLGMFVPRAHTRGVWVGVITGISISVWGGADTIMELLGASPGFIDSVRFPWHPWMIMGLGNIASFTVGWLASLILPAGRSAAADSEG